VLDEIWARTIGGMNLRGKNGSNETEKPVPVALCPPQTPHSLVCNQAQASTVTDQQGILYHISPPSGPMTLIPVTYSSVCIPCTTTLYFPLIMVIKPAVAQWLRSCATNRKVDGSIPDGVTGIFLWHNPSDPTMALGLTQPLTEMSTRSISWGKDRWCVRLTTLPPSCAAVM
jgi:hypothetical protein